MWQRNAMFRKSRPSARPDANGGRSVSAQEHGEQHDHNHHGQRVMSVDRRSRIVQFVGMDKNVFQRKPRHQWASMKRTENELNRGSYFTINASRRNSSPLSCCPQSARWPWKICRCSDRHSRTKPVDCIAPSIVAICVQASSGSQRTMPPSTDTKSPDPFDDSGVCVTRAGSC